MTDKLPDKNPELVRQDCGVLGCGTSVTEVKKLEEHIASLERKIAQLSPPPSIAPCDDPRSPRPLPLTDRGEIDVDADSESIDAKFEDMHFVPLKIILLITPRRGTLSKVELSIINKHYSTFIYDSDVHKNMTLPEIANGTAVIVEMRKVENLRWFGHQARYIKEAGKSVQCILMLSNGESSTPFLERKHVWHVQTVRKDLPDAGLAKEEFIGFLLSDVLPRIPGRTAKFASAAARFLCA